MSAPQSMRTTATVDPVQQLAQLRAILLGVDREVLQQLQQNLLDDERQKTQVARIISEALSLRASQDNSLALVLAPTVEKALSDSIEADPHQLANALYPVMGPAIRKSIHEVLSQTLETFNQLLEQSLSPRALGWRFDAWRTGRSYPEVVLMKTLLYQVEQVFLIHRETGLLLKHVVSPQAITKDPDMVSGMLTAIQDFIQDSFEVEGGESLKQLRLGDLTVFVEQGPYAVLAAVVRGNPPADLKTLLADTQVAIHSHFNHALHHYSGDNSLFEKVQPLLNRCLTMQLQEKKRNLPWLALLAIGIIGAGLSYWFYQKHLVWQAWQQSIHQLQAEPGIVVVDHKKVANDYYIELLRDPLAVEPQQLISQHFAQTEKIDFKINPYLSIEPSLVLRRAHTLLKPPDSISLSLQHGVLQVVGQADLAWQQRLKTSWPLIAGLEGLDITQLEVHDPSGQQRLQRQAEIEQLLQTINTEQAFIGFEYNRSDLTVDWQAVVQQLSLDLLKLTYVVREQGQQIDVVLSGNTDEVGTPVSNAKLAAARVATVRNQLIQLGVPAALLAPLEPDENKVSERNERSVRYQVRLY